MTNKAMNTLKAIVESGELEPNRELGMNAANDYLSRKKEVLNVPLSYIVALVIACSAAVIAADQWLGAF